MLVAIVGLLIAVMVGLRLGSGDYRPIILGSLALLLLLVWFATGQMFWPLTIASCFLAGTFPILGGSFNTFQVLMAIGVAKYVVEEIIFKRRPIARISRLDLILIIGFMGVLTFHAVKDRFGMRFLGSSVWGGRNYVNVFVGLAAFFIVQSVSIKSKVWAKLPYLVLAVTTFDLLIAITTTVFPSSIYKIFPFYSAVSAAGVAEIFGEAIETARIGAIGNFGLIVILLVLAVIPLRKLFTPSNFFRSFAFMVGWVTVLFSSYRSTVFNAVVAMVMAGIRDLKWGLLALLPVLAVFLFGLSFLNSQLVTLPKQVQRSLTFLPGKWDAQMQLDAAASNDFRKQVWTIWTREYFPVHPWFGRGFGFRSEAVTRSVEKYDPYENKLAVEVGNVHNGFFSTVDAFGIIGAIFFVAWNLRILARTFSVTFRGNDPAGMTLRFLALYLAVSITCYWIGAQSVGSFLPQEFALAGVFLRLQRTISSTPIGLQDGKIQSKRAAATLESTSV